MAQFWDGVAVQLERLRVIVGPEYSAATLADFAPDLAAAGEALLRRAYAREPVLYGIRVHGNVGRGKTHFAAALVRIWVLAGGKTADWIAARSLFRSVRDTYRGDSEQSETEIVERYTERDLLVIDDIGREGAPSEHVLSVLHEILDERIRFHRPTIVTTNLGDDLPKRYGPALASRLALYDPVVLDGADRRQGRP